MLENKVSIITPMYNAEKFIEKTIKSVLSQTYNNWELLILNDNSTDNSLKIVEKYASTDNRIQVISMENNIGVVRGRNHLIEKANGRYIAFLDSDDYWHEEKLEKQIQFMSKNNFSISCTEYTRVSENEKILNIVNIKSKINYNDLLKNNYLGCLTVIYDTDKLGKRYFKERKKNEDYVLWLEIIKEVKIINGLKENLAYYRVLDNSRSSNKLEAAKDRWDIYRNVEKLSLIKSIYSFFNYVILAYIKKYSLKK